MKKIFAIIIFILIIVLMIVCMIKIGENAEAIIRGNCAIIYLSDVSDSTDLMQLCTNEDCTSYFEKRINNSINGFNNNCFEETDHE